MALSPLVTKATPTFTSAPPVVAAAVGVSAIAAVVGVSATGAVVGVSAAGAVVFVATATAGVSVGSGIVVAVGSPPHAATSTAITASRLVSNIQVLVFFIRLPPL